MPESRRDRDGERLTKEAWITLWKTKFPPPDHYATLDSPWIFELDGGEAAFMQTDADSAYEAYGIHCTVLGPCFENGEFDVPGDWLSILPLALLLEKRLKKLNSDFDWDHAAAKKK